MGLASKVESCYYWWSCEEGFGKKYARGINDKALSQKDKFIQVVSCNTHNISSITNTIGISSGASAPEVLVNNFINDLKKRFTVKIDEVEAIKENVVFKIPKKLN